MKTSKFEAPKPLQANQNNGTLKGPKQRSTNSTSGGGKKGLSLGNGDSNAKIGPGGKAVC